MNYMQARQAQSAHTQDVQSQPGPAKFSSSNENSVVEFSVLRVPGKRILNTGYQHARLASPCGPPRQSPAAQSPTHTRTHTCLRLHTFAAHVTLFPCSHIRMIAAPLLRRRAVAALSNGLHNVPIPVPLRQGSIPPCFERRQGCGGAVPIRGFRNEAYEAMHEQVTIFAVLPPKSPPPPLLHGL
jgi:hypothetical protein